MAIMINQLKLSQLTTAREVCEQRMYIEESEVLDFWESRTVLEMQEILTIKEERLIEHLWNYITYYLQSRKSSAKNAYCIMDRFKGRDSGEVLMWFYDCKIFKSSLYDRQNNEMVSSFLIRYKDKATKIETVEGAKEPKQIYEFLNPNLMSECATILKCKASCLLKMYQLFGQLHLQPLNGDVAILTEDQYYKFIYSWTHYPNSWEPEQIVKHLFRGLMFLMQNQIALAFSKTLSEKQKQVRRFQKPVAVFQKPKLKETYTMVEEGLGDVEWNTLKISAFKFKYRVVEDESKYVCFRVKEEDSFDLSMHSKIDQLDEEDRKIIMAFDKIRSLMQSPQF